MIIQAWMIGLGSYSKDFPHMRCRTFAANKCSMPRRTAALGSRNNYSGSMEIRYSAGLGRIRRASSAPHTCIKILHDRRFRYRKIPVTIPLGLRTIICFVPRKDRLPDVMPSEVEGQLLQLGEEKESVMCHCTFRPPCHA